MRYPSQRGTGDRRSTLARAGAALACAGLVAGLDLAAVPVASSAAAAAAASQRLTVAVRAAQAPAGAQAIGALRPSTVIQGSVVLTPRNGAELSRLATELSMPSSPLYKHYLRPGQFVSMFGPSRSTVRALSRELTAAGVHVTNVSSNRLVVSFVGTARQVGTAFHTSFASYRLAGGARAYAATSAVRLPAAIASDVESVVGLNDFSHPSPVGVLLGAHGHARATAPRAARTSSGPSACAAAVADAGKFGGLTDQQIAASYGMNPLYNAGNDGSGQTIAVYELEPFSMSDLQTFDTCYFGAAGAASIASRVKVVNVDGGQQVGYGSGEAELDVEDVTAVAPGANIEVYEAPNTFAGLIDNFNAIVSQDTAQTVTSSWYSGCEAAIQFLVPGLIGAENSIFEQAAVQGQTVLEASGDDGSDLCSNHGTTPTFPLLSVGTEASQPYVLSVGGTTITKATDPPTEQVWNDGANWGAGSGGISSVWPAPAWQVDSGVPGVDNSSVVQAAEAVNGGPFCGASVCREEPDVSAQADEFTGAVTIYDTTYGGWITIGGTSSATPLWAAMLADIGSTAACQAAGGLGFVNPKLYAVAANPGEYKASFNDITVGNNDIFGVTGGLYPATPGFDMATGLGSPRVTGPGGGPGLAHYVCTTPSTTVPAVTGVAPDAVPSGGSRVVVTGSGFATGTTSDVAGITVGTVSLPTSAYTVTSPTTIAVTLPPASSQAGTGTGADGSGQYAVTVTLTDGNTSAPTAGARVIYYPTSGATSLPEVVGVTSVGNNEQGGMTATIYGAGFDSGTGTPTVTFGGVPATNVTLVSDTEITATVPPYSSGSTQCAPGNDPTTDICQVQVQVTTTTGSSAESTISPPFEGPTADEGAPGTGELVPAPSEFDYFPTPQLSSVTVAGGLASESGGSVATITGTGLGGALGFDWANVGPYQDYGSFVFSPLYLSGTEVVMALPPEPPTSGGTALPVTIQTEGSLNNSEIAGSAPSNALTVTYASTPVVSSIAVESGGSRSAFTAGPTSGGTDLVINGSGFADAFEVTFTDVGAAGGPFGVSNATSFSLASVTPTQVTLSTPGDNPGVDGVSVCDSSGCSALAPKGDTFTYYPVGNPSLTSISRARGPAGTKVTIGGHNLGFIEAVWFGSHKAKTFANVPGLQDSGSTTQITAVVPAGVVGRRVAVRVVTLESEATGFGKSRVNRRVTFTYTTKRR